MKNDLIQLVSTVALSALCAYLVLPRLIVFLKSNARLDIPNHRSSHKVPTPTMGGMCFFIGLVFAIIFSASLEVVVVSGLISLAAVLGLWDDSKGVSPKYKFLGQAIIATGFYLFGFSISPLTELTLGVSLPSFVDWMATMFFMLGLINAFNLIDGVDGLLIGLTLICSVVLAIIFFIQGQSPYLFLSLGMIGVSCSFLIYNFEPAKIFMGDTGSLFIGTYISSSVLKVAEGGNTDYSIIAISLVLFVCVDMLRLFFGRYLILRKPFLADRNHVHHVLLKIGWSDKKIVLHAYGFQLILTSMAFYLSFYDSFSLNLFVLILTCVGMYGLLQLLVYKKFRVLLRKTMEMKNRKIEGNHLLKSRFK